MPTVLGKKLEGQPPAPPAKSRLASLLSDRGELVQLPLFGAAWMQLIGTDDVQRIEAEAVRRLKDRGLELSSVTGLAFETERAKMTLAIGVRSADDHAIPFGTESEWGKVDPDTLSACWDLYADMRARLAPLDVAVTEEEGRQIMVGLAKKNSTLLKSFGLHRLVSWLLSSEFPPATSPPTKSPSGDSPPAP